MLRTRLWMGSLLVIAAVALLFGDEWFAPWYPCFTVLLLGLALGSTLELVHLLATFQKLPRTLCALGVLGVLSANWIVVLVPNTPFTSSAWSWIVGIFAASVLMLFCYEMLNFREPGHAVVRLALATWLIAYLGVLPCFLAQLRWLPGSDHQGTFALLLTIFVPKGCDIGAYFTGRLLGHHPMTPILSPKKTWEGAVGGLFLAVLVAVLMDHLAPVALLKGYWWAEVGFGLTVGAAGMLGDLAESLIKRDCRQKDASQAVPGFGGLLDVIDAVLFAAPVAYLWISFLNTSLQNT